MKHMKTNITTIVCEFRAPAKPIFKPATSVAIVTAKKPFAPFPAGTVRGPYTCGKGNDAQGGVQYLVKRMDGAWAPFIRSKHEAKECESEAREYAKAHI